MGSATDTPNPNRLIAVAFVGVALATVATLLVVYFQRGFVPGDAFIYLAAGERLNAGHLLYALSAGDRPIGTEPPFWTVPLLSPPPIAVLWRPLAALPSEVGVYVWWALDIAAIGATVGLMMRRRPILTSIAVIVLSIPLVYEIGVGNMNGLILLGLVLIWRSTAQGNERVAGALSGVLTAFKLTPAVLGWWLLTARRWSAVGAAIVAGLLVLAVSILGSGVAAHLTYLDVIRATSVTGARPLSLGGMALFLGLPAGIANLLPVVGLVAGLVAIAALRNRPAAAFVATVLTMVFGTPTVSINWFIYLLACVAPLVWPLAERVPETASLPSSAAAEGRGSQAIGT